MRVLYAIEESGRESYRDFHNRIRGFTDSHLCHLAAGSVVMAITEETPPCCSVIPFRNSKMALISLDDVHQPVEWPQEDGLSGIWFSEVGYPVIHHRTWPLGTRSPGVGLLTFFRKKKELDEKEFLNRWYNGHTPLTLEVHPNAGYVRNHVINSVPGDFPCWDGIVEEQYDPRWNLLNPIRFFGGSVLKMLPTMIRVYADVKGFIDYSSIHSYLTAEYRIKD